jgi:hypothetical protein
MVEFLQIFLLRSSIPAPNYTCQIPCNPNTNNQLPKCLPLFPFAQKSPTFNFEFLKVGQSGHEHIFRFSSLS